MNELDMVVRTSRLELIPWSTALIDAFQAGDKAAAEAAFDVVFPEPFSPPPETGDVLDYFRHSINADTSGGAFSPRMIVRSTDRVAIGSIGCGAPNDAGETVFGYSVYPTFEGNGYASEAARGIVDWALGLDAVEVVTATIPAGHIASEIVATRAGLSNTGAQIEDEGMTLNVWQRRRD